MVFSVSPSVTVREVDLTTNIPAVASNQGAIAGVFNWGPVGEVTMVTSEAELADVFGTPDDNNSETFFTAADFLAYSNQLYVVRANSGAATATATVEVSNTASYDFEAKYAGAIGNSIRVSYVSGEDDYSQSLFAVGAMTDDTQTNIFNTSSISFTAEVDYTDNINAGDVIVIGNDSVGYQNLVLTSKTIQVTSNTSIFDYTLNFDSKYTLAESSIESLSLRRQWAYAFSVERAPAAGSMHIMVVDQDGVISGVAGTILEKYVDVSLTTTSTAIDGTPNYYRDVINDTSRWIAVADTSADIVANQIAYLDMAGGTNGSSESNIAFGNTAMAYDLFKNSEQYDIAFVLQGKALGDSNLANYILSNIVEYRKDCILFISPDRSDILSGNNVLASRNTIVSNIIDFRDAIQSSSYWFMDSGYKYRYDKYNNKFRWVPLNGDVAGLAARVDPWESPAGYKRGNIKNVVKLAFNPNKAERDRLYGKDVNSVISQSGQGTILFGDKTGLGRSSAFDRINVRRLFIVVEKAIATVSASLLFDFNDEFTQTEFRNMTEPFLRDIKGRRGITDFRVVSDSRVNTPDVIDRNTFRANIFIKPARTINYIELTFIATRTGISFEELVGLQF